MAATVRSRVSPRGSFASDGLVSPDSMLHFMILPTTSIALSTRANALSVCVSRNPHDYCATDGYGAIHRQYPPGSLSMTQLDLGVN